MVVGDNESTTTKMQANHWQLCSGTTWGASPDGAHPGLHPKPLDAVIGQVATSYCPGSRHGRRIRMKHTKH